MHSDSITQHSVIPVIAHFLILYPCRNLHILHVHEKGWVLGFQRVKDRFVLPTFRSEYSDLLQGEDDDYMCMFVKIFVGVPTSTETGVMLVSSANECLPWNSW